MKPRLLFLHTGGTLGMTRTGEPGPLAPSAFAQDVLPFVRGLEDIASITGQVLINIDSSDMTPADWTQIAETIVERHDDFDGFVVLHGTDTMAFTACALSFMLSGLQKPVILTGSQRPLSEPRTDARVNLVHSAICARMDIPEVCLYFGTHLFRGNRTTKVSIDSYDAFASPNFPPLVTMGVDILCPHPPLVPTEPLRLHSGWCQNVAVVSIIPGMDPSILDRLGDSGMRAVILRGFGEGNVPQKDWPDAIQRVSQQGVIIALSSQCRSGNARPGRYLGSVRARDAGAIYCGDMTGEAVAVKTMWLLGQGVAPADFADRFLTPIAGELTPESAGLL